jgi:LPS O-antigen subunit length determinant protein (WzzB/FepE family)
MRARFHSLKSSVFFLAIIITLSGTSLAAINRDAYNDLLKSVDQKQTTAVQLINSVGTFSNGRFSNEEDKEDTQFAYSGFMARFESLREDREALEKKEIMPDSATLENYSKQYDRLISDLNDYLNNGGHY